MQEKKSNLSVASDLTRAEEVLSLAEEVGKEICVFKTHVDIIENFTPAFTRELQDIADRLNFVIFEDRKFADIGNTVSLQYEKGIYHIADWADIVNAHIVPGFGIIEGLQQVGLPKGRGLLLLAEMSSKGNLAHGSYTEKAVELADAYPDFVMGFISQRKISNNPCHIHMTPGIQMGKKGDALGQQYQTPDNAISKGSDIIIVGRGIYESDNPAKEAQMYRKAGWDAYARRS